MAEKKTIVKKGYVPPNPPAQPTGKKPMNEGYVPPPPPIPPRSESGGKKK